MKILTDEPRNYREVAKILGVYSNSVYHKAWKARKGETKTDLLAYKIACNLSNEILSFFQDDDNFKDFKAKKEKKENFLKTIDN